MNVNVPAGAASEVAGVSVATQGRRDQAVLRVEERHDGRHIPYYWIGFSRKRTPPAAGTDLAAMLDNRISVTPLRLDLTDHDTMTRYALALG